MSELGYQINDLVPSVKLGPFGRVNVTFDNCLFKENYGGNLLVQKTNINCLNYLTLFFVRYSFIISLS